MSDLVAVLFALYVLFALAVLGFAVLAVTSDPSWRTRRTAARVAFFCWAWPVLLLWQAVRGIKHLWSEADWGTK